MSIELAQIKLAIHHRENTFSTRWIDYCKKHNIKYKIVNCYDTDIIDQLKGFSGLLWQWSHEDYRAQNFARQLIYSLEKIGIPVFPNYNSCWHFDDKIGQKYLFEALKAPLVPSYVFYDKASAINWIEKATFPKVFKLRGGAGSFNVSLIKNKYQAKRIVAKAFVNGFPLINKMAGIKQRLWILKRDKNVKALIHLAKGLLRLVVPKEGLNLLPRQKGYVYFQDYLPDNLFDDRIIIIGQRAIAVRRHNRQGDFRASGSGVKSYDKRLFSLETIKLAFDLSKLIGGNSLAFDFIFDGSGRSHVVEVSYSFIIGEFYDNCPGYWDEQLNWHDDNVDPQRYIIEDFISSL
jgi:hypothetical protein